MVPRRLPVAFGMDPDCRRTCLPLRTLRRATPGAFRPPAAMGQAGPAARERLGAGHAVRAGGASLTVLSICGFPQITLRPGRMFAVPTRSRCPEAAVVAIKILPLGLGTSCDRQHNCREVPSPSPSTHSGCPPLPSWAPIRCVRRQLRSLRSPRASLRPVADPSGSPPEGSLPPWRIAQSTTDLAASCWAWRMRRPQSWASCPSWVRTVASAIALYPYAVPAPRGLLPA